jgi:hypothetical protein
MKDDVVDKYLALAETAGDKLSREHDDPCPLAHAGKTLREVARELRVEMALAAGSGPAQVATDAYRQGWDNIFGGKRSVGQA